MGKVGTTQACTSTLVILTVFQIDGSFRARVL